MSKAVWTGIATGAALVAALGGYLWWQSMQDPLQGSAVPPSVGPAASVAKPSVPPSVPGGPLGAALPPGPSSTADAPWATPSVPPSAAKLGMHPPAVGKAGAPSIEDIQRRLQGLTANGRQPTALEVDAILADLQRNQGTNVVGGVNLQALRDNMARADRMQQIAQEVQTLAANPRKEDLPRLQALSAEMQRLQASVSVPTGPAVAAVPAK
jgi:hypothetical protein